MSGCDFSRSISRAESVRALAPGGMDTPAKIVLQQPATYLAVHLWVTVVDTRRALVTSLCPRHPWSFVTRISRRATGRAAPSSRARWPPSPPPNAPALVLLSASTCAFIPKYHACLSASGASPGAPCPSGSWSNWAREWWSRPQIVPLVIRTPRSASTGSLPPESASGASSRGGVVQDRCICRAVHVC